MIRDLGPYVPKRSYKLNPPILAMLFNAVHDRHEGRVFVLQVGAVLTRYALPPRAGRMPVSGGTRPARGTPPRMRGPPRFPTSGVFMST